MTFSLPSLAGSCARHLLRAWPQDQVKRAVRPDSSADLTRFRRDPSLLMSLAGMSPDPWQSRALRSPSRRVLFLCSRQSGKSLVSSALALREALLCPPALVLLLSPSLRQSGELFRHKLLPLWRRLGSPQKRGRPTRLELELGNGSRIVSLPENEETVRCFSDVRLLVIDEASRLDDSLYRAVRPMLAVSDGALVAGSTPFGQRGFFYEEWEHGGPLWQRYKVTAEQCPRIGAEFLAEERLRLGERWFAQEYECVFSDAVGQLIPQSVIDRAMGL